MNLLIAIILFALALSLVEGAKRLFSVRGEITRKVSHVLSAIIVFFLPYFLDKWQILFIAILFIFLLGASKRFNFLKSVHSVTRKTWGEVFFPAGVGVAALAFLPGNLAAFQFGILVMGFSDALCGAVGSQFGRHKIAWLKNEKTWEGTATFFVVTFLIFVFYFRPTFSLAISGVGVALLLAALEAFLGKGWDNLFLPVASGLVLYIIL